MRTLLLFALLLIPVGQASAVFYNNTETIEIGDGTPPEPGADSTNETGVSGGSSSGGSSSGSGSQGGGGGGDSGGAGAGGNQTGDADNGDSNGTNGTNGTNDPQAVNEDDVLDALLSGGALSGPGALSGGSNPFGGAPGGVVRVIGDRVRAALSKDVDLREILTYWRRGTGKAGEKELGLIAASTALRDANVQEISFTASTFEITYRSRGYLLAVIPWSFPVKVKIVPESTVLEERIVVRLPWYSFFVREFFTVGGLRRDLDEVMTKTRNENTDSEVDGTALFMEAISAALRQKVGTVADSVLLGIPQQ